MKNIKEKIQNNKGITLVALVVTIIVLLILAGVSLSAVFSQQGIFNRAENAVDKHSQSKARETLDLVFSEAQMKKYDEGLTDDELNKKIEEVGDLIPKEDPESKYQLVIVDGYIFEIDRSVPKVVEYKGPADGIIITAVISGNNGFGESVTVKGSIKIYGEGSIASSSAEVTKGSTTITGFPSQGGDYTISNITEDTDIKITATDSKGKSYEKIVKVVIKRDTTAPTVEIATAEAERMKIKISATGHDKNAEGIEESGIDYFEYSITPADGIKDNKATGRFDKGQTATVEANKEATFTITITAVDKVGQISTPKSAEPVTTIELLSLEDLKKITPSNYSEYIGKKVDYNPTGAGTWRVFYVEDSSNTFGDGAGTIYLKRDYDSNTTKDLTEYVNSGMTKNGLAMMKKLNPAWREYTKSGVKNGNKTVSDTFLDNEKASAGLCDSTKWTTYATGDTNVVSAGLTINYAIGSAPIEMWCKAQNTYRNKSGITGNKIGCGIKNDNGYGYKIDGGALVEYQSVTLDTSKEESKVLYTDKWQWLASPSAYYSDVCRMYSGYVSRNTYNTAQWVCPIVSIKL